MPASPRKAISAKPKLAASSKQTGAAKPRVRKPAAAKPMAAKTAPKASRARKLAAKKQSTRSPAAAFHGGSYTTPKGNVTLGLPAFWTLRQTNDDLELESPSGATSVLVTAFHREEGYSKLDAREYLEQFLKTAPMKGRPQTEKNGHSRAISRFRDQDGDCWQVEFFTDGDTLLLVTMHTSLKPRSEEARTATQVLGTLRLQ